MLAQASFEAILELYPPGLGLHTDICYTIGLNALDVTLTVASNHVLQSIWDLKFATKSYRDAMSEFKVPDRLNNVITGYSKSYVEGV